MAFSAGASRGTAGTSGAGTTTVVATSAALTVGKLIIAVWGGDNVATTDSDSTTVSGVSDPSSNTWTKLAERTNTVGGAAGDGTGSAVGNGV